LSALRRAKPFGFCQTVVGFAGTQFGCPNGGCRLRWGETQASLKPALGGKIFAGERSRLCLPLSSCKMFVWLAAAVPPVKAKGRSGFCRCPFWGLAGLVVLFVPNRACSGHGYAVGQRWGVEGGVALPAMSLDKHAVPLTLSLGRGEAR